MSGCASPTSPTSPALIQLNALPQLFCARTHSSFFVLTRCLFDPALLRAWWCSIGWHLADAGFTYDYPRARDVAADTASAQRRHPLAVRVIVHNPHLPSAPVFQHATRTPRARQGYAVRLSRATCANAVIITLNRLCALLLYTIYAELAHVLLVFVRWTDQFEPRQSFLFAAAPLANRMFSEHTARARTRPTNKNHP